LDIKEDTTKKQKYKLPKLGRSRMNYFSCLTYKPPENEKPRHVLLMDRSQSKLKDANSSLEKIEKLFP
jgi:hypothetical protein